MSIRLHYPDFLVVGMPRSGTSFVQDLICRIQGVVSPPETHFFVQYFFPRDEPMGKLTDRVQHPMNQEDLETELRRYLGLYKLRELQLNTDAVAELLDSHCDTPMDLFAAIVQVAAGEGSLYGEKTPDHLKWWEPLSRAHKDLKFIIVVRDPRAVFSSQTKAWGSLGYRDPFLKAEEWRINVKMALEAKAALGDRVMLVRYEDVVRDELGFQRTVARFLETPFVLRATTSSLLVYPHEQAWKSLVGKPAEITRVDAWRQELDADIAQLISTRCYEEMRHFGYDASSAISYLSLSQRDEQRSREFWEAADQFQSTIRSVDLNAIFTPHIPRSNSDVRLLDLGINS